MHINGIVLLFGLFGGFFKIFEIAGGAKGAILDIDCAVVDKYVWAGGDELAI